MRVHKNSLKTQEFLKENQLTLRIITKRSGCTKLHSLIAKSEKVKIEAAKPLAKLFQQNHQATKFDIVKRNKNLQPAYNKPNIKSRQQLKCTSLRSLLLPKVEAETAETVETVSD